MGVDPLLIDDPIGAPYWSINVICISGFLMRKLLGPIVGFTFLAVTPAYAYVDPGAAMLAIQGLVGAVAVVGLFFRNAVSQLFGFLRPRKSEQNNTKEGQDDK